MNKKKHSYAAAAVIAVMVIAVIMMYAVTVFQMTSQQTRETGMYRLETISGELESTINEAKLVTLEAGVGVQPLLDDKAVLRAYLYNHKAELITRGIGAFNVYAAGPGWDIIPDFIKPDGYVTEERSWYTGAVRGGGDAYVTPPYIDALTGNICYTVSALLADGETVVAVDYTMENIQAHVKSLLEGGLKKAIVVTGDGIIAGGSDESYIGQKLTDIFPEYSGVFYLAKSSSGFVTHRVRQGLFYENLFATRSASGWYLIVSESDWDLYRTSYIQLIVALGLTLLLFVVVIILYIVSARNQRKAESALNAKEEFIQSVSLELETPLRRILANSETVSLPDVETAGERLTAIHESGEKLSDMVRQILSYSSIVRTENKEDSPKDSKLLRMSTRYRDLIFVILLIVMLISFIATAFFGISLGNTKMENSVVTYDSQLSEWIYKQKSILDMFVSMVSTDPSMLRDYESAIERFDSIVKQFPEISAAYMANPRLTPTVYMNSGWLPDNTWKVEERGWYKDTLASSEGWSVSAPYYDEQTGLYCVTISGQVHDASTGEFLGNFGIDFYMDKLTEILSGSYTDHGYAFLTDAFGNIINHPDGRLQMSENGSTNISELSYGELAPDSGRTILITDYNGLPRAVTAKRNELTNFAVYSVSSIWTVYGQSLLLVVLAFAAVVVCIIMVFRLLTRLIKWQNSVTARMQEAADAATEAGKAKSRFLAQMSHEIRTPINAVLGMNEMILRESEDKDITEYSENIQTAGRTLLSLVNSILDFSKIEDGKMEILSVQYELAAVVHNLVNSVSERARVKGLEFVTEVDESLPSVLVGDDVRITQVITNLLTNAVKYTDRGTVRFEMKCASMTDTEVTIAVSVKDTGIGIREEDMDKLFESFSRLDEKRNRSIEGTGLGMAIVTKLLALMDSELSVESVYGSGSVFSFSIKQGIADKTPLGSAMNRHAAAEHKKTEKVRFDGARVLVTDDNVMNLKVARNFMKLFGIKPDIVSSGADTIEIMKKKRYDIVFLDHMMPKMDGIETLQRLKEEDLLGGAAVIALTANAIMGAREQYLEAGFDDYLPKPMEIGELEQKLLRYLPDELAVYTAEEGEAAGEPAGAPVPRATAPADDEVVLEFAPGGGDGGSGSDEGFEERLSALGFNMKAGQSYCAGDPAFYRDMLREYAQSEKKRLGELNGALEKEDWAEYKVYVHGLKSISKTIGADDVSALAKELEDAAKAGDGSAIKQRHGELTELFRKRTGQINDNISGE